jgi:hypothetical protein
MFKNTCKTVYSLREHLAVVRRRSCRLVYYCVQRAATIYDPILVYCIFPAKQYFSGWAMLGSNQRPLPCEGRSITSWLFAGVQNYLQNRPFVSGSIHVCSPLFVWVGVLLVYMSLTGPPLHPSVSLNTSCRDRYKGGATAFLRNMFSSLAVERGPKRCGHIKEAERRQKNRRHVPQNALVFGGAREHRVFPGRSGNLVQHRPNPPNRRTVS